MKTHNGKVITSGTKIAEGQVTGEEVRDASLSLADLDPSGGTAGQVPVINEAEDAVEWATPSSGPELASSGTPAALGSAARGTSAQAARADHVHPTDGLASVTRGTIAELNALVGVTEGAFGYATNAKKSGAEGTGAGTGMPCFYSAAGHAGAGWYLFDGTGKVQA